MRHTISELISTQNLEFTVQIRIEIVRILYKNQALVTSSVFTPIFVASYLIEFASVMA
jgi:uncharacterized membrane protein